MGLVHGLLKHENLLKPILLHSSLASTPSSHAHHPNIPQPHHCLPASLPTHTHTHTHLEQHELYIRCQAADTNTVVVGSAHQACHVGTMVVGWDRLVAAGAVAPTGGRVTWAVAEAPEVPTIDIINEAWWWWASAGAGRVSGWVTVTGSAAGLLVQ